MEVERTWVNDPPTNKWTGTCIGLGPPKPLCEVASSFARLDVNIASFQGGLNAILEVRDPYAADSMGNGLRTKPKGEST